MGVRVRVKNFQSIKDAEVIIAGFVVITGPNNSGKTAFLRGIRGLFTNAPAGPLLRTGEAYLTVELEFDDGTLVVWEKGWEKPGQKGATINRYTLNGVTLEGVGRGVPPEVEALGVRQVSAASDRIWPQIAEQFGGTLFLVDRPGSAVAEALSDVARVGKLTSALRLSEKDRRAAASELKVRLKDKLALETEAAHYDGLDAVGAQVRGVQTQREIAVDTGARLVLAESLRSRLQEARGTLAALEGFDPGVVPSNKAVSLPTVFWQELNTVRALKERQGTARADVSHYAGFEFQQPDPTRALKLQGVIRICTALAARLASAKKELERLQNAQIPQMPDTKEATDLKREVECVQSFQDRLIRAQDNVTALRLSVAEANRKVDLAAEEVRELLGARGICPTCDTVCETLHEAVTLGQA
jgi:hypothetical protein